VWVSAQVTMNTIREIIRINEREAELGIEGDASWHAKWKVPRSLMLMPIAVLVLVLTSIWCCTIDRQVHGYMLDLYR